MKAYEEAVREKYPNISRATVYRLLAEAADEGKVRRLKLTDGNDRYDITMKKHFHGDYFMYQSPRGGNVVIIITGVM